MDSSVIDVAAGRAEAEKPGSVILLPGVSHSTEHAVEQIRAMRAAEERAAVTPGGLIVPESALPPVEEDFSSLKFQGQKIGVRAADRSEIVVAVAHPRDLGKDNDWRRPLIKTALTERAPRLRKYKSALVLGSHEIVVGPRVAEVKRPDKTTIIFTYETWVLVGPLEIKEMWILTPERRYLLRWPNIGFKLPFGEQSQFTARIPWGMPSVRLPRAGTQ